MKRIEFKKGKVVVETPLLNIDEAAAYVGLSRTTFCDWSAGHNLPYDGHPNFKRYDIKKLYAWATNQDPERPFGPPLKSNREVRPHRRRQTKDTILVNPVNGKVGTGSASRKGAAGHAT